MLRRSQRQGGVSLVELMVGLALGLVILSGVVYTFIGSAENSLFQLRASRFVLVMRDVMDRMVQDVRRAGYRGATFEATATPGGVPAYNPFAASLSLGHALTTELRIGNHTGEPASSCILYAYNRDDDNPPQVGATTTLGTDFDADINELYGFRMDTDAGGIKVVEMLRGLGGGLTFDCDAGTWEAVTDPGEVAIDTLSFSLAGSACANLTSPSRTGCYDPAAASVPQSGDWVVRVPEVTITLSGYSVRDPSLTYQLQQRVSITNLQTYQVP